MRNLEASSQKNIDNYENIIKGFANENEYNVDFVSTKKLDEEISLEGEIIIEHELGWIDFAIYNDGLVNLDLFLKDKRYLKDYLLSIINLSNSLSKRQLTLDEVSEFLENDEYIKTNEPNHIYKHKGFGWWTDSTISYLESENTVSITICTGILH